MENLKVYLNPHLFVKPYVARCNTRFNSEKSFTARRCTIIIMERRLSSDDSKQSPFFIPASSSDSYTNKIQVNDYFRK